MKQTINNTHLQMTKINTFLDVPAVDPAYESQLPGEEDSISARPQPASINILPEKDTQQGNITKQFRDKLTIGLSLFRLLNYLLCKSTKPCQIFLV